LLSVMLLLAAVETLFCGILAEILIRVHYAQGDRRVYHLRREWGGPRRARGRETSGTKQAM